MTVEQIEKKFPNFYPSCGVPENAKEQNLDVFRVCMFGAIDNEAFYSYYELWKYKGIMLKGMENGFDDIHFYSVSVYEKYRDAKRCLSLLSRRDPRSLLAKGNTLEEFGPCLRSKDECNNKKSHVDWWLYEDAQPYKFFSEVNQEK